MHDTDAVRGSQRIGDLHGEFQAIDDGDSARLRSYPPASAADELHHDAFALVDRDNVVNRDDIGMIQRRRGAGFLNESGALVPESSAGRKIEL